MTQSLAEYGWNDQVQESFEALGSNTVILGRVVRVDRGSFLFATQHGVERCHLIGADWPDTGPPVTGDWVAARLEPGFGLIADVVLPRSSEIKRIDPSDTGTQVLVANIDTMFVLHGLDRPLRVGRVERFCLTTWDAGATPVVLITKTDLEDSGEAVTGTMDAISAIHEVVRGVDVIPVSSATGAGLHLLAPYLQPGTTVGLFGESGAGKSTLVNRLLGEEVQTTAATRRGDSKGRHTTASREVVPLPSGAVLIDTPGLRSLALVGDGTGLEQSYADVEALFDGCRFRDCGHDSEPGCAVIAALESGELEASRWAGYQKLLREIDYEKRRAGDRARIAELKEWNKKLAKFRRDLD